MNKKKVLLVVSVFVVMCASVIGITACSHKHSYDAGVVTAPTCTEQGYTTHTCVDGDRSYVDNYVPALGHTYTDAVTQPTCTERGYTTHTCTVCGETKVDTYVAALGHRHGDEAGVATVATCTEGGYTTYTCTVCGETYNDDYVDAAGHKYVSTVSAPTCTKEGYTTNTCTVCNVSIKDDYVPATGEHTLYEAAVAPTCTVHGAVIRICKGCNEIFEDDYIDALGHTYANSNACAECGEVDPSVFAYELLTNNTYTVCGFDSNLTSLPENITIPGTYNGLAVTEVKERAFESKTNIKSLVFEYGVTAIGDYAFKNCTGLTGVVLPSSLASIGNYSFEACTGLASIFIPSSVTTMGSRSFWKLSRLVIYCERTSQPSGWDSTWNLKEDNGRLTVVWGDTAHRP